MTYKNWRCTGGGMVLHFEDETIVLFFGEVVSMVVEHSKGTTLMNWK